MYEHRYNPFAANVDIVKDYLKSGKVLFIGILYFLSLGLSIATLILNPVSASIADLTNMFSSMGIDTSEYLSYSTSAMNSGVGVVSVFPTVITSLFTILSAIAFIIMFAKSRSTNPDSNPSSGASIMRVLSLITFIFTIIGVVLAVALYVLFIVSISSVNDYFNGDTQAAVIFQVITGVAVSLIIILMISYTACQKNFYRSIKYSLNSVELQSSGAVGYGVFNIIFSVFVGLSMIGSLIILITGFNLGNLLLFLSMLLSFLMLVMTASFALGYNSHIKREKYGYNEPYGGSDAPYYPDSAPNYGAPSDNFNYPKYNMPPQQNMPPYNETPDSFRSAPAKDQTAYCPNCGAPVEGKQPFCSNCGYKY